MEGKGEIELDTLADRLRYYIRGGTVLEKLQGLVKVTEDKATAKLMLTSFHRALPMRALMRSAVQYIEDRAVGEKFRVGDIPGADAFEQICIAEMLTKMGWLSVSNL